MPETPSPSAQEELALIDLQYLSLREETRRVVQRLLVENAGKEFPSIQERRAFANTVRELLRRVDLRIKCPGCGKPSILRAADIGKNGVFQFDHFIAGSHSTHRGPKTLPEHLEVIEAPPDRRVKRKETLQKKC